MGSDRQPAAVPLAHVRAAMSTRSMRLVGGRDEWTGRHIFVLLIGVA